MSWAPTPKHNAYTAGGGIGLMVAQILDDRLYLTGDFSNVEATVIALCVGWFASFFQKEPPTLTDRV